MRRAKNIFACLLETFWVSWPLWVATLVTVVFGRWTYLLASEVTVQEKVKTTRWEHFLHGRPNEMGDALAGFVGSLTLIWVVASVIQQSIELRAQRREFRAMVRAQYKQAIELRRQTEFSESEMESQKFRKAYSFFNQKVISLIESMNEIQARYTTETNLGTLGVSLFSEIEIRTGKAGREENILALGEIFSKIVGNVQNFCKGLESESSSPPTCNVEPLLRAIVLCDEIGDLKFGLSNHSQMRLDRLNLSEGLIGLQRLNELAAVWKDRTP